MFGCRMGLDVAGLASVFGHLEISIYSTDTGAVT